MPHCISHIKTARLRNTRHKENTVSTERNSIFVCYRFLFCLYLHFFSFGFSMVLTEKSVQELEIIYINSTTYNYHFKSSSIFVWIWRNRRKYTNCALWRCIFFHLILFCVSIERGKKSNNNCDDRKWKQLTETLIETLEAFHNKQNARINNFF